MLEATPLIGLWSKSSVVDTNRNYKKFICFLSQLCYISFATFTYITYCVKVNTLFTSPDFCLKLAFQCKDKHIVFHFYFLLKSRLYFTVKINMWPVFLNMCLNLICRHIFDFWFDDTSLFFNFARRQENFALPFWFLHLWGVYRVVPIHQSLYIYGSGAFWAYVPR